MNTLEEWTAAVGALAARWAESTEPAGGPAEA
jgi:hypothetical protein